MSSEIQPVKIKICAFQEGDRKLWDEYVLKSSQASYSHLSGWSQIIESSYGHKAIYLWAQQHGDIKGILPLILFRNFLFNRSLISLPFLDDGGIVADDSATMKALYDEGIKLYKSQNAQVLDLRHRHNIEIDLPHYGSKLTLILNLLDGPDKMWNSLDAKVRNQVRKAIKAELEVGWFGQEALPDFYRVFATNMRDLGSPVHSQRFFAEILKELPANAKLILIKKNGRVIGGGLSLSHKNTLSMPWASSLREFRALCPNNLLYWEAIRWACQNGFKQFDFGRSSPGSGTYHFKKQWGAVEEPLHWQFLSKRQNSSSPLLQSDNPRYRFILYVWQRLPIGIANAVGPLLRRQIAN